MTAEERSTAFFTDQTSVVEISLPNGWVVSMRHADPGIRRELDRYLLKLNAKKLVAEVGIYVEYYTVADHPACKV